MELTALELRDRDEHQFYKEYYDWCGYALDYEWWDYIEEGFKNKCTPMGIDVTRIFFTGFYSQGDHAGFEGRVDLSRYMKYYKMDEEYPALFAALCEDGGYIDVTHGHRWYGMEFDLREGTYYVPPCNVFQDLEEETWNALISEQWADSRLSDLVTETCTDLGHDLWGELEKDYASLTSEEAFIESCECNNVKFEYEGAEE